MAEVAELRNLAEKYRFSPLVDGVSLVLVSKVGVQPAAALNLQGINDGRVLYMASGRLQAANIVNSHLDALLVTKGAAAANRALVLDANSSVSGITTLSAGTVAATNFNGTNLDVDDASIERATVPSLAVGTITGSHYVTDNNGDYTVFRGVYRAWAIDNQSNTILGDSRKALRITAAALTAYINGAEVTVWHSNNDGVNSGLDADLLDGQQGSYYTNQANITGASGTGVLLRASALETINTEFVTIRSEFSTQLAPAILYAKQSFTGAVTGVSSRTATATRDGKVVCFGGMFVPTASPATSNVLFQLEPSFRPSEVQYPLALYDNVIVPLMIYPDGRVMYVTRVGGASMGHRFNITYIL